MQSSEVVGKPSEGRLLSPDPPWGLAEVVWGMLWTIAVIVVLLTVMGTLVVLLDLEADEGAGLALVFIGQAIANVIVLGGIYLYVRGKGAVAEDFGLRPFDYGRWWWVVLAFVVGAYATLGVYTGLIDWLDGLVELGFLEPEENIPDEVDDSVFTLALAGVFSILVAPITEELFFRGFLLGGIKQRFGLAAGIVGSSLVFGLVHGQLGLIIPFSLVGGYLALIYLYTRSLWSSIACHLTFNGLSILGLALS
jgi:CAAX protease family protein